MKILIIPGNVQNAKSYPHWDKFLVLAQKHDIRKIEGMLPEQGIINLIHWCDIWISIDSFVPHLVAYHKLKNGIVIWGKSDPLIFGYKENANLLKDRKYLRPDQFRWWRDEVHDPNVFISPERLLQEVEKIPQQEPRSEGAAMFCEICGQVIVLKEMSQVLIKYDKEGEEHVQHVECLRKKEADKKTEPNVLE